jgi:hypothetical protein
MLNPYSYIKFAKREQGDKQQLNSKYVKWLQDAKDREPHDIPLIKYQENAFQVI